ncbi:MAG: hypothetical protein KGH54_03820, partial [Candidatus Micrarchaeota archaeon]|nr:hypothetical protein [Candidatus Micrarchaeota archaeon]
LSIDRGSFEGNILEEPKAALPRPTRENLEGYLGLVLEHFAREYGLRESMSWESILMLIPMGKEKVEKLAPLIGAFGLQRALELEVSFNFSLMEVEAVREFAQLIKAAKETNVREYAIKQSGSEKVEELNYTKEELLEYSVISIIGSRSKEREDKAVKAMSMIVGIELINRAREEFRAKHKALMGQLIGAVKQSDFVLAHKILGDTEAHSIMDVLNAANYREIKIANASFLRAVESKNPLDYDGRVQIACVYLPNSSPIGIRAYCKDDNVVLIRYDIGDKAVGSAICYKLGDKFLIDSVEGHRTFRKDQIFEIVYEDLLKRAKDHNSKEILFHKDAPNETPKLFIAHLGQKGLATEKLGVEFDVGDVYIEAHKKSECYVVKLAE